MQDVKVSFNVKIRTLRWRGHGWDLVAKDNPPVILVVAVNYRQLSVMTNELGEERTVRKGHFSRCCAIA